MAARPLTDDWRGWLKLNMSRGCDLDDLFQRASRQGFDPEDISRELGGHRPPAIDLDNPPARDTDILTNDNVQSDEASLWRKLHAAPMTDPANRPRAWRLDTTAAQVYEIPDLLSAEECESLVKVINKSLRRSTVTRGPADYRTSRTCDMKRADPDLMNDVDNRLSALVGCDPAMSEPIQGQRYDVGEYFKAHTDWFAPNTKEFERHAGRGGQRTWTIMIYLNDVAAGGGTRFDRIGREFRPVRGSAVAWNNLFADGVPNPATLHEAMPVEKGSKYVITKWFRERAGLNI
jgi:prolyl 4-hydroxylase